VNRVLAIHWHSSALVQPLSYLRSHPSGAARPAAHAIWPDCVCRPMIVCSWPPSPTA